MKKENLNTFSGQYILIIIQNRVQIFIFLKILVYFCLKNTLIFFSHLLLLLFVHSFLYLLFFFLWQDFFYFEWPYCSCSLLIASFRFTKTLYYCLSSSHILSVVSMGILMIGFIFSTVSTFVLSSNTNIFDSALIIFFCRCQCLKNCQILLVQIPISDLKNQMLRPWRQCHCFLQLNIFRFPC